MVFETIAGHTTAFVPKVQLRSGPLVMTKTALVKNTPTKQPAQFVSIASKVTKKGDIETVVEQVVPKLGNKRGLALKDESQPAKEENGGTRKSARLRK